MKKITTVAFGLLLVAAPAIAQAGNEVQESNTVLQQEEINNTAGNAQRNSYTDAANGGVSNVGVANTSGIVTQNVNVGASSNVGSATNVAIIGGYTSAGGNTNAGNPNDTNTQVANAVLEQVSVGNVTGEAAQCAQNSAYSAGVSNVGVNGSQGVISQQINTGVTSNVGAAIGISIH
jgi:hypothetical protein